VELWREVAELAQSEGMLEEERGACEELLSLTADDSNNIDRLAQIYEETERYEDLVALLSNRAEELTNDKEAAAVYWRMGQIRETRLQDIEGAMGDYGEAWSRDVEQRLAYTSLETYYRHLEDWPELLSLMSSRADRTSDTSEALASWLEMGEVAGSRLDDVTESLRCYERALEVNPNCEEAIDEIIRLYQRLDRVKALAALYERKAGLVEDVTERCSYMGLAAELYANRLSRPEQAEEVVNAILDEMPEHPTARRVLAEIRIGQEAYAEAAELLEAAMGQMGDTHRVDALLHLGRLYGEHLGRPADALRAYETARDLVPDHPDINQSLHQLYEQTEAWDGLRETLETEYERSGDPIARCGRALAVAKLYLEQLEDDDGFFAWIQLAREARRDSPEVAEALVSYHTSREEWSEAAPNLEWLVNYLDGKRLTHEIPRKAHHLAQILTQMGDKEKALEYHKMAMQADGSYLPNLLEYGELLVNQGAWDRAVRVYQNILLQRSNLEDETVATVLERLSGCADELGWGEEASQYRKRLHTDFPDRS
ncbi:MAG: tetratricopeptide repeat protein, partial [Myxococcota bacterium]|nr:tetratricopeptide repeat protein [Myxococcota bacterium]